ncbi:MAG: sigma-70 family RNA polymerase sigma factor [Alphaproteobacteria bacterium]|nr:MAG: sigma-70 family RNA polymerase sigma factor [Alphaproteobacteria bacterium]
MQKPIGTSNGIRGAALDALDDAHMKKLTTISRLLAIAPTEPADLLQDAFLRWLQSDVPIEGPDRTYSYVRDAMKSIRYNARRHLEVVKGALGERMHASEEGGDVFEMLKPHHSTVDDGKIAQQAYDLFADDPEVQEYILKLMDGASPEEIQAELGWTKLKYQAVQKRRARAVAKFIAEGKL